MPLLNRLPHCALSCTAAVLCLLGVLPQLSAQVSLSLSPENSRGSRIAVLQNSHLKAVFDTLGGRLVSLVDKGTGNDLVWDNGKSTGGSCKDQFPPIQFDFCETQYAATIVENSPNQGILRLRSTETSGKWKFLTITRTYTLKRNQRLLACKLSLHNQRESMAPMQVEYWQHNYFGVKNEDSRFFAPTPQGVKSLVPSEENNKQFFRQLIRGWLAMIGTSGNGVAVMPEYRRLNMAYAWWCKETTPLDTLEWRMVPEAIPEGTALDTTCSIGVIAGLNRIDGAGEAGCAMLQLPDAPKAGDVPVTVKLSGFVPQKVQLRILNRDQELATLPAELKTGTVTTASTTLKQLAKGAYPLIVQVLDEQGKCLFDLTAVLRVDGSQDKITFQPLEERRKAVSDSEPWQFQPSSEIVTPHYRWLSGSQSDPVLFLLPSAGIRDAIEMQQRMPLDITVPTLFPYSWALSWWTNCVLPAGSNKNGTDYLLKDFLTGKTYRAMVMGSDVRCPWEKPRILWSSYPAAVRQNILNRVRQGAGLLYINPTGEDQELKDILTALPQLNLKDSMDLSVAPFFDRTTIHGGTYGKGRIVVVRYPSQGYLIPQGGGRSNALQILRNDHRYQEYQFAILCRLLKWSMGTDPILTKLSWQGSDLQLEAQQPGTVTLELLDRYTSSVSKQHLELKAGLNRMVLPPRRSGRNFLHVTMGSRDFAFTSQTVTHDARILSLNLKSWYEKREPVTGTVTLSPAAKGTGFTVALTITDQTGRVVHRQNGTALSWNQRLAAVNRHTVQADLLKDGVVVDTLRRSFNLPEQFNATENYANLLWTSADTDPEYSIPYRWEADRRFGFNFIYAGSPVESAFCKLMQLANVEVGSNWLGPYMFHTAKGLNDWQKTHDRKYLIRPYCPNNPKQWDPDKATEKADLFHDFGTRHVFQLGDEMSMTYYNNAWDVCFCDYCLKDFRKWLAANRYPSLEALNKDWVTSFTSWDQVKPMTRIDVISHPSVAPWVEHRLYMDHLFARTLLQVRQKLQDLYPGAYVGPTGVNTPPHPYGGNWNFYNMSALGCVSMYGPGRIPSSFRREQRLVMQYGGYSNTPAKATRGFWEGLIAGTRSSNNWWEPIFVLPDLRESQIRQYYKDILWELRSGVGDLFHHSRKLTNQVAILHSQVSLISNYIKQRKTDYFQKELSFATALEDAGLPYRFVAPEEIIAGALKDFQALILPEASAMSDQELNEVKDFVKRGGILMADYDTAIQTQHCTPRRIPALNDFFGVKTRRFKLKRAQSHDLPGFQVTHVGTGIKATTGTPQFHAVTDRGKTPLVITRQQGKGQTILLNFVTAHNQNREHAQDQGWPILLAKLLKQSSPASVKTNTPVMHGHYANGQNLYVGLQPIPPRGNWQKLSLAALKQQAFTAPLHTTKPGWLYDVRKGQKLGYGKDFQVTLTPGDGTILALMPYEIKAVTVDAPKQATPGQTVIIKASVKTSAPAGHHVLLMTVKRPDGTASLDYRTIKSTPNGYHSFQIPFAYNDPQGTWTVTVKDAASGLTTTHAITLTTGKEG